jgi:hypothetical protein
MKLPQEDTDIREFLKDFLPKLKAANEELEAERKAGTLEKKKIEADDGAEEAEGQYIEMNLGLGVLEEKDPNAPSDSSDSDSDTENPGKEKDILGKLMRREKHTDPAQIQEVKEVEMKDT